MDDLGTALDGEKATISGGTGISHAPEHVHPRDLGTDEEWFANVYQGDKVPQLTLRAVLMGGVLGSLMSVSNLYTSIKVGWSFGVAITACVLSFAIWNSFVALSGNRLKRMSLLENNCMQSTASAAGYSTGATVGTAFGALLLITAKHVDWKILLPWTFVTAALGVFLAVPLKRQMINQEKLAFPSGIAAAETLKSLYAESREAILQARSLIAALVAGLVVGLLHTGEFAWQKMSVLFRLPELYGFPLKLRGIDYEQMPGFGFEPSVLLLGAGMIVGLRVSVSMIVGSLILYLIVGPEMINIGEITQPSFLLKKWALWTGTACMVTSGLTAFGLQWKTIARSFQSIKIGGPKESVDEKLAAIEVPTKWLFIGLVPLTIVLVALQYFAFQISIPLGFVAVILSSFLSLVACRSTGETDITPVGPMGKISQLTYALLSHGNMTANLMAGSVTANIASSSADLLTDLKSGYLLGANPRKQFIAQFIGIFFGAAAVVPAWYLMIKDKATLEAYNPPSVNMWKAVAEALSKGLDAIPPHAQIGMVVGGLIGVALALVDVYVPKKLRPYTPSAMGIGLSWVMPLSNSLAFFVGAVIAYIWSRINKKSAALFVIPVASGAVAGESLMCAALAMLKAGSALMLKQ